MGWVGPFRRLVVRDRGRVIASAVAPVLAVGAMIVPAGIQMSVALWTLNTNTNRLYMAASVGLIIAPQRNKNP